MPEKLSFEESLRHLEQIAQTLESGQAGLDESMELYAQAAKLIAFCQKKLDNAQLKMEKLEIQPAAPALPEEAEKDE